MSLSPSSSLSVSLTYRPTTPGQPRIRLINLQPDLVRHEFYTEEGQAQKQYGDLVSCTMTHVSLESPPPFVALSYAWGDSKHRKPILVNGAVFQATENLESALRHLRSREDARVLWVDAICINQNDDSEKGEQVGQMDMVYSRASSVISWLGPATENSDAGMKWMLHYGRLAHEFGIGSKPHLRLRHLLKQLQSGGQSIEKDLASFLSELINQLDGWTLKTADPLGPITGLYHLFDRAYWSRHWCVQEVVLAPKMVFICGETLLPEDHLHHSLRLLRNYAHHQQLDAERATNGEGYDSAKIEAVKAGVWSIPTVNPINLLKLRRGPKQYQFPYLVRILREFQATDPRDKVFSALSIASDAQQLSLVPDYAKSCTQVYTHFARMLISRGYLDVLTLCSSNESSQSLPSWVPDLSQSLERAPLQQLAMLRKKKPVAYALQPEFSASGGTKCRCDFIQDGSHASKVILSLDVVILGAVDQVGGVWNKDDMPQWFRDIKDLSAPSLGNDSSAQIQAIWRTAATDQEIRHGDTKPRLTENTLSRLLENITPPEITEVTDLSLAALDLTDYGLQLRATARERRPFSALERRMFGIAPCKTQPGDVLALVLGADVPFIFRRMAEGGNMQMLGEVYVHGIMDGEAMAGDPGVSTIRVE